MYVSVCLSVGMCVYDSMSSQSSEESIGCPRTVILNPPNAVTL